MKLGMKWEQGQKQSLWLEGNTQVLHLSELKRTSEVIYTINTGTGPTKTVAIPMGMIWNIEVIRDRVYSLTIVPLQKSAVGQDKVTLLLEATSVTP